MGKKYRVLNLYACFGGNRYKWDEVAMSAGYELEVVAVEWDAELSVLYRERFPNDIVVEAGRTIFETVLGIVRKQDVKQTELFN